MWQWCRGCCCCEGRVQDEAALLSVSTRRDNPENNQFYTVRRISSFGRTVSKEDIDDSCTDLRTATPQQFGDTLGNLKVCRVQPEASDCDYGSGTIPLSSSPQPSPGRKKRRWHRALDTFRPRINKAASSKDSTISAPLPAITVSSPDIVKDIKTKAVKSSISSKGSIHLKHAGTVADVSSISALQHTASWLKSQSMQDITSESEIPLDSPIINKEDSADLARSFGIDTTLYTVNQSCRPGFRSQTADVTDGNTVQAIPNNDCTFLQEFPSGTLHFSCTYYIKTKKLLVHINKIEDLVLKGENTSYEIVLRLTILPQEKHTKISKHYSAKKIVDIGEDFQFSLKDPSEKMLRVSVFDSKYTGKYSAIGHALLPLEDVQIGRPRECVMKLYKQSQSLANPGILSVTLSFQSNENRLKIHVQQGKNISVSHLTKSNKTPEKCNTYVKVTYFYGDEKIKTKKSQVIYEERSPLYDFHCTFKLSTEFQCECYIVITVMLKGLFKKDLAVGRLIFGPLYYAEGHALTSWGRVILCHETISHSFRMYL